MNVSLIYGCLEIQTVTSVRKSLSEGHLSSTRILYKVELRRCPETDILRLQDVGLARADDPSVLAWAASERRILLTHAVNTVTVFAYERVIRGLLMPDVFEVPLKLPIGAAIDDIILCSKAEEGDGQTTTFHSYEVGMWEFHPLIQDGL